MAVEIDGTEIAVRLKLNKASVRSVDAQVKRVVSSISKKHTIDLKVRLSSSAKLQGQVKALAEKISAQESVKLKTEYSNDGYSTTLAGVKAAAARMSKSTSVKLKTEVDSSAATKGVREIEKLKSSVRGAKGVFSGIDTSPLTNLSRSVLRLPFTALRGLITAAVALSPALISLASSAGVAAASLVAIAPAAFGAAGALGALVGAFFGVAQAMKTANTLDDQVTQSNSKSAATRLKNAKAIVGAQQSVANAERRVADAQRSAQSAQRDINRAREDAKRNLEDLRDLVSGFALDEEGARIAVERAAERLTATNSDVKASFLDRREAAYDLRVAEERLTNLRRDHVRNTRDLSRAEKKGVEGSQAVVDAKNAYKDALDNVAQAQDGVRSAQESLNTTIAQQAEQLKTVNPAAAKLAQILKEMSPAGREMFYVLRDMKGETKGWRREIESKTLPGFISFLRDLRSKGADGASTLDLMAQKTANIGESLGQTTKQLGRYAKSRAFRANFANIMDNNRKAFDNIGAAVNRLIPSLMRLFSLSSPLVVRFSKYLKEISGRFEKWIGSFSDTEITQFFRRAGDEMSKWWSLAVNLGRTLTGVLRAAFPSGSNLTATLVELTDRMADFVNSKTGQQKIQEFFDKFVSFVKNVPYGRIADIVKGVAALSLALKVAAVLSASNPLLLLMAALAIQYPAETAKIMESISSSLGGVIRWAADNPKAVSALLAVLAAYKGLSAIRGLKLPGMGGAEKIQAGAAATMLKAAKMQATAGAEMLAAARLMAGGGAAQIAGGAAGAAGGAAGKGWKNGFLKGLGGIGKAIGSAVVIGIAWEMIKQIPGNEGLTAFKALKKFIFGDENATWKSVLKVEEWKTLWGAIKQTWKDFSGWFNTDWRNFWARIGKWFVDRAKDIRDIWKGLWNGIGLDFQSTTNRLLTTTKNLMRGMLGSVNGGVKAIGGAFNGLSSAAMTPVNFIINEVYTNGLKKMFNGAAMALGLKSSLPNVAPIQPKTTVKNTWTNVPKFAKGGVAPGSGNGDTVPAMLTPGEGILTKSEMKKLGGPSGFEALRERIQYFAKGGVVQGGLDLLSGGAMKGVSALLGKTPGGGMIRDIGIASIKKLLAAVTSKLSVLGGPGGILPGGGSGSLMGYQRMFAWIKERMGSAVHLTSGYRAFNDGGYHPKGRAVDLTFSDGSERRGGGKALEAFNLIKSTFMKNIKELIWDFAGNKAVLDGRNWFYTGPNAGPGTHNDHIHWAMDNGGPFQDGQSIKNFSGKPEMVLTNPQAHALEERLRGGEEINLNIVVNDERFRDIIRVEVDKKSTETAHILNRGRRS